MIWSEPLSLTLMCVDVLRSLPRYVSHDHPLACASFVANTGVFVDIAEVAFVDVVAAAPLAAASVTTADAPVTAGCIETLKDSGNSSRAAVAAAAATGCWKGLSAASGRVSSATIAAVIRVPLRGSVWR